MYSIAEIQLFIAQVFSVIDTSIGSTISIPQGGSRTAIVTKSVTFWEAWMKFKEKIRTEHEVSLNIEFFKVDAPDPQPVQSIATGSFNSVDILRWMKENPHTMFYMSIRYRSKETAQQGIYTFANQYEKN